MVNGKSLRNNDVEINHNLVVHNGLEAGDGILSATQNAVEVKLKLLHRRSLKIFLPRHTESLLPMTATPQLDMPETKLVLTLKRPRFYPLQDRAE